MPEAPKFQPQNYWEFQTSVLNLFELGTLYTATLPFHGPLKVGDQEVSFDGLSDMAQEAGYRGFQWFPNRSLAGLQLESGVGLSFDAKDSIRSLHQSFRSEKNLRESWAHPNRALALQSYFLLPERIASLNNMERIQRVVGRQLPVVLYPENSGEERGTDRPFEETGYQVTAELLDMWGVENVEELLAEGKKRGYTHPIPELFHSREVRNGRTLGPWQEWLPLMLEDATQIHLSIGRYDGVDKTIPTMDELRDILSGTHQSELYQMLKFVHDSGWRGRVVLEVPAPSMREVLHRPFPYNPRDLIRDHRRLVGNVEDILF